MMKRTLFRGLIVSVGLMLMLFVAGCSSTLRPDQVRSNMSPALDTADRTDEQSANDMARVVDHNTRNIWDDFRRLMLLDKTSKLTPYPIP